ncbi:MAG: type II secretion system secretin GspD [Hydrogenovibrio sp.]|uniref:type II secretion system secretin GspD n=1 Tax=Hydrogenovibrio sp. TaxID=2065821 RepID=UPI0028704F38|nr:type II secretion system secretin GspD [Hydrogenovibrio sp.]MDR9499552.1 type II secretion system secretin GspD [Hydrogenovibrio sp.]
MLIQPKNRSTFCFVSVFRSALVQVLPWVLMIGVVQMAFAEQKSGNLTQSFKNADIEKVIEAVAQITKKNYIIDPRVKGKVTLIAPSPMPAEALHETLLSILRVHGYVAIPTENAIQIMPTEVARDQAPLSEQAQYQQDWVTEVIKVNHVPASKLVAVLRPLVAREGHLVALQESNRLVATDTKLNLQRIKTLVGRVDVPSNGDYELVSLNHASAEELVRTLSKIARKEVTGESLRLQFDQRTNRIILAGPPSERLKMRALIADLDTPTSNKGSVEVVYLRYAKAEDLAPVLQKIAVNRSLLTSDEPEGEESVSTTTKSKNLEQMDKKTLKERINIESDARTNSLIISAPPSVSKGLKKVIKELDIRRAQVLIEAILVEVSESKQAELGVEWAANGSNGAGLIDFSGTLPAIISGAMTGNSSQIANALGQAQGTTAAVGQISTDSQGWGALIRALNSDNGSNVLATPTLLTLDNEEAEIIVGKEVPFQTGSYTTDNAGASNPFTTVERQEVGLKLKLKPQINEGSEVFLEIDQEVSSVLPADGAVDLQTSKRRIKTNIIVGDGNMVVLGGLLDERETLVTNKIPGLGDIPGLGALFRSEQNKREKVNLMIFLRAVIVKDGSDSDYYSRQKYYGLRSHQQDMLEANPGLLGSEGNRPTMPELSTWQSKKPPSKLNEPSPAKRDVETNNQESFESESEYEQLGL